MPMIMAPILQWFQELTNSSRAALFCLAILILLFIADRAVFRVPYAPNIPLVREPEGATRFSLRTRLAYHVDCAPLFRDAYENYLKKGKPVIIPGLGFRKEVILPPKSMRWVLAQPDAQLDVAQAFAEIDQVKWSLGHDKYVVDAWQGMLVKTELNRVLENTCSALNDELKIAFDAHFGTDTENWTEIDLLPTIRRVVAQAASRFTVGLPLCRDQDYLDTCIDINDRLIMNAGVTGALPRILQPLAGMLVNLPLNSRLEGVKKKFIPLWKERLETLKYERDDPSHKEPQDHLQMMIRYAERERQHELHDMDVMTRRLIVANFGSMHQTSYQVVNMLLNILGSDAEFNTISILRDETNRILAGDDTWTKAKVRRMVNADSVARETLRLNSFGGRALFRKVMVDDVTTEDGYDIPKGTIISFLSQPAQTDGAQFEDPLKYDPFRHTRSHGGVAEAETKAPPVSFVTTGADYLPFGHGKHACPGRFLIDFELKMIMAYVLKQYDLEFPKEYGGKRPENTWVAEALFPPNGVKIMVKRRMTKE